MIMLSEPCVSELIEKLETAIRICKTQNRMDPFEMHDRVKNMYNWRDIAKRTEIVYNRVVAQPNEKNIIEKLKRLVRNLFYFVYFFVI
jgi:phosphatidylinositol N-acetylglucosaminyltransferase subunit A